MRKLPGRLAALALSTLLLATGVVPAVAAGDTPATATPAATAVPVPGTPITVTPSAPVAPSTPANPSAPASASAPASTVPVPVPLPVPGPPVTVTPSAPVNPPSSGTPKSRLAAPFAAPAVGNPYLAEVLTLANKVRAAHGAGGLVWNSTIATGSQQWTATLYSRYKNGTLDMNKLHRGDAGLSILPGGADMYSEIIGFNTTPQEIINWWMGSPAHKAALLDKRATDIGMGQVAITQGSWYGLNMVVANLAGYESSRPEQPQPAPVPVATKGDVAAVDSAGNLFVYDSAQGSDLWQRRYISAGWGGVQQLEVVDFNADGRQDIIAKWSDGRLTVSYGQSNGTLAAQLRIGVGWGSFDIVVTNWRSADKFPGIVAKNRVSGELFLYPSVNGDRFLAPVKIGVGWGPLSIVGADFDGDGRADLLARNAAGQLLLYRGNGAGGFLDESRKVIGSGWSGMIHLSGIENHLGNNAGGILARDGSGNLHHYAILKGSFGNRSQIGTGGWQALRLGS